MKTLEENSLYMVELEEDPSRETGTRQAAGTYRVIQKSRVLFETQNRDKALGVFEHLTQKAGNE